jgi:hypothetical protein
MIKDSRKTDEEAAMLAKKIFYLTVNKGRQVHISEKHRVG